MPSARGRIPWPIPTSSTTSSRETMRVRAVRQSSWPFPATTSAPAGHATRRQSHHRHCAARAVEDHADNGLDFQRAVGGPFTPATQTYSLTNNAANSLNWSLANTSAWFTVSPISGTLVHAGSATNVTVSVASIATTLAAGSIPPRCNSPTWGISLSKPASSYWPW